MRRLLLLLLAGCAPAAVRHEPFPEAFDRTDGWVGSDAAYSVDLGDRILWLFGDTFVGRVEGGERKGASMIRNSIAIQRGAEFEFGEREFFRPPDGRGWMWPWAGFVAHGRLHLFLNQFEEAGRADVWNFRYVRTWLAIVENYKYPPASWRLDYRPVPHGAWGVAALVDGDTAWIFGTHERDGKRSWRVAKVRADLVADFSEWTVGSEDLFWNAGAEGSVSRHGDRFVAVYTENGLSADIVMRTARTPEGPWSGARVVHRCPEAAQGLMCYAGKGHPELSDPGELVVTYAVNSTDFGKASREAWIYKPRFVRVTLPP